MSKEEFARLPEELTVRALRYRVGTPGCRVREITLATTPLDAARYEEGALAELYYNRWQVEVDFLHIKIRMKLDILRCETVARVLKELAMFGLAYNLERSAMAESARARGVPPERIGLLDTVRWLIGVEGDGERTDVLVNRSRRGRVEPRVVKQRPKQYMRMTKPRAELCKLLPMKGF